MTERTMRGLSCAAGLALLTGVVVSPTASAAPGAVDAGRTSTAAGATVPQGSVSLPPFTLPTKGACRDVPIVLDIRGTDRMYIEVGIKTTDDQWIGESVMGRADAQRFPRQSIEVCRKAVDDGVIATVPIRPGTDYVLSLVVQVGGRKGPTYTDTDTFTTGR